MRAARKNLWDPARQGGACAVQRRWRVKIPASTK